MAFLGATLVACGVLATVVFELLVPSLFKHLDAILILVPLAFVPLALTIRLLMRDKMMSRAMIAVLVVFGLLPLVTPSILHALGVRALDPILSALSTPLLFTVKMLFTNPMSLAVASWVAFILTTYWVCTRWSLAKMPGVLASSARGGW
jgi:hypothetical protein